MIALAWTDGRAVLTVGGATISLSQADATHLARDLANGHKPDCTGYPIPTDVYPGEYVITEVTRVANNTTIVKIARVKDHEHGTTPTLDEMYADAGSVTLTPAEVWGLVDQLKSGGAK
jgi:exosome complex RNA-binding protein Csl4